MFNICLLVGYVSLKLKASIRNKALKLEINTEIETKYCKLLQSHVEFKDKKSRKENPQKLTQLSSRSHPRHLGEKGQHKTTSP